MISHLGALYSRVYVRFSLCELNSVSEDEEYTQTTLVSVDGLQGYTKRELECSYVKNNERTDGNEKIEGIWLSHIKTFLETGDYNVIGMDWSVLCQTEYVSAMRGAKIAGQQLGDFINWLSANGVNLDDIHLIGHSLGAHVAGIGGDSVREGRVGRITGLDPAGPGYGDMKEELKLDPQDAKLVDVIHTFMKVIGTARPTGHIDFYPNGGRYQPGCPELTSLKVADSIFCNHGRSFELFAESIRNPKSFKSKRCKSLEDALDSRCLDDTDVYMGLQESYKNGLYYFKTRSRPPYSFNF